MQSARTVRKSTGQLGTRDHYCGPKMHTRCGLNPDANGMDGLPYMLLTLQPYTWDEAPHKCGLCRRLLALDVQQDKERQASWERQKAEAEYQPYRIPSALSPEVRDELARLQRELLRYDPRPGEDRLKQRKRVDAIVRAAAEKELSLDQSA